MFRKTKIIAFALVCSLVFGGSSVMAKITAEEAERLKKDLTPVGAEKAGNADGTIPAWTGEGVKIPADWKGPGHYHPDPFAADKPLYVITAQNVDQYADKLTDGQKALFKVFPDTFKMPVYQSRRPATYPDWFVENTYKCAQTAEIYKEHSTQNAWGGIPYPMPKTGVEPVINHLVRWRGIYRTSTEAQFTVDAKGRYIPEILHMERYFPYYDPPKEGSNILAFTRVLIMAPPRTAGDRYMLFDDLNPVERPRQAWRYFSGQRRVRRAPVLAYDTPLPVSGGVRMFDDYDMFYGGADRYHWELKGKKEILIPYNSYKIETPGAKYKEMLTPGHLNPEYTRYELHRVWVVEGKKKEGIRHIYPRRVKYLDEDSWCISISDRYDEHGNLWKCSMSHLAYYWEAQAIFKTTEAHHDLNSRRYNVAPLFNEETHTTWQFNHPVPPDNHFTAASIRSAGIR